MWHLSTSLETLSRHRHAPYCNGWDTNLVELALPLRFNVMAAKTRGASTPNTAWHSEARDAVLSFPPLPCMSLSQKSHALCFWVSCWNWICVLSRKKKIQDWGLVINADVICAVEYNTANERAGRKKWQGQDEPWRHSSGKGESGNPLNETERGQGHICLQFSSKQKKAHPLPNLASPAGQRYCVNMHSRLLFFPCWGELFEVSCWC